MTPRCALACPRCSADLPADAFYGPCEPCRRSLRAEVRARFLAALDNVATALADGWSWDDADACWRRGDEVRS